MLHANPALKFVRRCFVEMRRFFALWQNLLACVVFVPRIFNLQKNTAGFFWGASYCEIVEFIPYKNMCFLENNCIIFILNEISPTFASYISR